MVTCFEFAAACQIVAACRIAAVTRNRESYIYSAGTGRFDFVMTVAFQNPANYICFAGKKCFGSTAAALKCFGSIAPVTCAVAVVKKPPDFAAAAAASQIDFAVAAAVNQIDPPAAVIQADSFVLNRIDFASHTDFPSHTDLAAS